MAEDLTDYLLEAGVKTRYLALGGPTPSSGSRSSASSGSASTTVLVGVNLLPASTARVSLVAILDAGKEGSCAARQR